MNFTIEKNGPVVPNVPNQKFFNSVKFASLGGNFKFKAGDVSLIYNNNIHPYQILPIRIEITLSHSNSNFYIIKHIYNLGSLVE